MFKETILTSKKINQLTDFQYRVWSHLILYVDDYGRGSADAELIKCFAFPRRKRIAEADIAKALADLAGMGCILLYEVDGESYFCFPNWSKHQRIQQKRSKFPEPPDEALSRWVTVSHGDSRLEVEVEKEVEVEVEKEIEKKSKEDAFALYAGENEKLLAALHDFRKMRKAQKSPMTAKAETLLLTELEKLSTDREEQIAILNQSIMNGWKSVYPLKRGDTKDKIAPKKETSFDLDAYTDMVRAYRPKFEKKEEEA